jgi:hypothetical protein
MVKKLAKNIGGGCAEKCFYLVVPLEKNWNLVGIYILME